MDKEYFFLRQRGGIELLLLLCCLVGVVIFLCFTLAIASALENHPVFSAESANDSYTQLTKRATDLSEKNRQLVETLSKLEAAEAAIKIDTSLTSVKAALEHEVAELESALRKASKKPDSNTILVNGGAISLQGAMVIECKSEEVVIYPGKIRIPLESIESSDLFVKHSQRFESIVLLVRPKGFASYFKSYGKVQSLNKRFSYEPIDKNTNLAFLK